MLGVGIGGTAEKAMLLAKEALLDPIDIHELREKGAASRAEELRLELYEKINRLGIGAEVGAYLKAGLGPNPHQGAVYVVAGSSSLLTSSTQFNHPAMVVGLRTLGSFIVDA